MTDTQPSPVLLERHGDIAWLTFNRPERLNPLDRATATTLLAHCRALTASPPRVVVLRGAGKGFMAGGDLAAFRDAPGDGPAVAESIIDPLHAAIQLLRALPVPVLASVHGAVAGAGVSVMAACDLAIAADDARFTLAYTRIGASPDGSSSYFLPRLLGLRKAMELILLSEPFDAAEALRLGLVNKVVPAAALADETHSLATRLAEGPTAAFGRVKALLNQSLDNSLAEQLDAEKDAFMASAATEDFNTAITAFFAKQPVRFHGR